MAEQQPREHERELTFAELAARASASSEGEHDDDGVRARIDRSDELLDDLPAQDHHLGRFAGWHAARKLRWIVGGTLGLAVLVGVLAFITHSLEQRRMRLHPLPEVEATIAAGTPREMTVSDGQMRVALAAEPPAINLLHLPDRDISLARWSDKAQFKVEVRDGKTVKLVVLTGEIVETLTTADAKPLL